MAGKIDTDDAEIKEWVQGLESFELIAKENIDSIVVGEKHYGKLDNNAYTAFKRGVSGLIEIHVMCYEKHCLFKQGFIEGCMLEPFYINPDYEKGMKNILKYLQKENDERVSLDELQKVAKAINKIVYKNHKIRYNNLHHSLHNQSLRESYNDF